MLDEALDFFLELILLCRFLFFHLSASKGHVSLVLLRRGGLLGVCIAPDGRLGAHRALKVPQSRVDILIRLVHVLAEVSGGFGLVEFERLRLGWSLRLL